MDDKWFADLAPLDKLFWLFIIDRCDNIGVWETNLKMASFLIGYEYSMDELLKSFGDKIHVFDNGYKWWVKSFIDFQHGILDRESTSKPIVSYFKLLEKHNLSKEYAKGIHTLQGKARIGKALVIKDSEYTEIFEKFWAVYPKKKGKGEAFKSFQKKTNKPPIEELISMITELTGTNDWTKSSGQFIPMPATWLNQSRWDDENDVVTKKQFAQNGKTFFDEPLCDGLNRKDHLAKYGSLDGK
jgi:hypothetical protein